MPDRPMAQYNAARYSSPVSASNTDTPDAPLAMSDLATGDDTGIAKPKRYWHRMYEFPRPQSHAEWLAKKARQKRSQRRKAQKVARELLASTNRRNEESQDVYQEWLARKSAERRAARQAVEREEAERLLKIRLMSALSTREQQHREWHRIKAAEARQRQLEITFIKERAKQLRELQEQANAETREARYQEWLANANARLRTRRDAERAYARAAAVDAADEKKNSERKARMERIEKEKAKILEAHDKFRKEGWKLTRDPKTGRYSYQKPCKKPSIDPAKAAADEAERKAAKEARRKEAAQKYREWKAKAKVREAKIAEQRKRAKIEEAVRKRLEHVQKFKRKGYIPPYSTAKAMREKRLTGLKLNTGGFLDIAKARGARSVPATPRRIKPATPATVKKQPKTARLAEKKGGSQ